MWLIGQDHGVNGSLSKRVFGVKVEALSLKLVVFKTHVKLSKTRCSFLQNFFTELLPTFQCDSSPKEMIPNEADYLLGYATVPGYVSFRSRNHGSWYIRKLVEFIEKLADRYLIYIIIYIIIYVIILI